MTPVHGYKIDIHAFEPVLEDVVGGREERKNRKIDAEIVLMMVKRDHRGIGNILVGYLGALGLGHLPQRTVVDLEVSEDKRKSHATLVDAVSGKNP